MPYGEPLPSLYSERGRGLSEIKGRDPMDRRVEVEKKESYAQALRDQIAANAIRHSAPRDEQISSSKGRSDFLLNGPPVSTPGSSGSGSRIPPPRSPMLDSGNAGTADKVAQVQDLMRQRLHMLQEEQQRQWQRVQEALQAQEAAAHEVLAKALREGPMAEALSAAERAAAESKRESKAYSEQVHVLVEDLSSLRKTVERLEGEVALHGKQLLAHAGDIQRHAASLSQIEAVSEKQQLHSIKLEEHSAELQLLRRLGEEHKHHPAQLAEHAEEIRRLKCAQDEFKKQRAEDRRDQELAGKVLAQLQSEISQLKGVVQQVADVPAALARLRKEMPAIAAAAVRQSLDAMPAPTPPTPVPPSQPVASKEAYALLRGPDGDEHELRELHNTVGRNAAACNACVTGNQAVSGRHACIEFNPEGRSLIKDLASRNGTFVNERRVPCNASLVLHSGDLIRLGADGPSYSFEFGPAWFAMMPREPERVSTRR